MNPLMSWVSRISPPKSGNAHTLLRPNLNACEGRRLRPKHNLVNLSVMSVLKGNTVWWAQGREV